MKTKHPDEFRDILKSISKPYRHWAAEIIFFRHSPSEARSGNEEAWHKFREKWVTSDSWLKLSEKRLQQEFDKAGYKVKIGNNTDKNHFRKTANGLMVGARRRT